MVRNHCNRKRPRQGGSRAFLGAQRMRQQPGSGTSLGVTAGSQGAPRRSARSPAAQRAKQSLGLAKAEGGPKEEPVAFVQEEGARAHLRCMTVYVLSWMKAAAAHVSK